MSSFLVHQLDDDQYTLAIKQNGQLYYIFNHSNEQHLVIGFSHVVGLLFYILKR